MTYLLLGILSPNKKSASQNAESADKQREAAHSGKENNDLTFLTQSFKRSHLWSRGKY